MRYWAKLGLFLSSYFPLFLILTIKNYPDQDLIPYLIVVAIISIIVWVLIILDSRNNPGEDYKILKVENRTHESLNYLAPYLIAFLNFDFSKWQDTTVLVIFFIIIFVVYMTSDLIYTNPLVTFFGYKIYRIKVCKSREGCEETEEIVLMIAKVKIDKNTEIKLKSIDEGVYLG